MTAVWILGILLIVVLAAMIVFSAIGKDDFAFGSLILAVLLLFATLFTWMGIDTARNNDYNEETQRLCDARHGVLSQKDNLCYVDGKPVEFRPGEWYRPKK